MIISPTVAATFTQSADGFTSRCDPAASCPPYVIAAAAADRVEAAYLMLPAGYDSDTLDRVSSAAGFRGRDVHVTPRQAAELAVIGQQLLTLDSEGKVIPSLSHFERESMAHLISVVGQSA